MREQVTLLRQRLMRLAVLLFSASDVPENRHRARLVIFSALLACTVTLLELPRVAYRYRQVNHKQQRSSYDKLTGLPNHNLC